MKGKLEKFIDKHSEELNHRMPDPAVLDRILQQIKQPEVIESKPAPKTGIVVSFRAIRWLAAACVLMAAVAILWKMQQKPEGKPQEFTKNTPKNLSDTAVTKTKYTPADMLAQNQSPLKPHTFNDVDQDMAIRKNQVGSQLRKPGGMQVKQVLLAKLENPESPAGRIAALSRMDRGSAVSRDVVDVLVKTLNSDPNSNVRLAAMDGLAKFYRENYVRKQLVSSLKKQQDPVVQIALISLLTKMRESAILNQLETLVKQDSTIDAVKESAYNGIFELRGSSGTHRL
ncbi:HEAT repeat domain-containing protein [Mucilaginibacter sp. CSA2-8R]|uniref:HEAT repeat domain-containing protein n=1 Tax=Mucilaginibacter sp. CSA2-8R TaxID=3141542 RepID=UPI00315CB1EC